jgi:dihydrofolate reductase
MPTHATGTREEWLAARSPFKDGLNNAPKYVASRTLDEPLPWPNSTLLRGDVADAIRQLKQKLTRDLTVTRSGELLQTLMRENLIEEYLLFRLPGGADVR